MITNVSRPFMRFENILCVYRNYSQFRNWVRAVIFVRIVLETLVSVGFLVRYNTYYMQETIASRTYFVLAHVIAIIIILLPWLRHKEFMKALSYLDDNAAMFKNMHDFKKRIKEKVLIMRFIVSAWVILRFLEFIEKRLFYESQLSGVSEMYIFFIQMYLVVILLRLTMAALQFSWVLMVIAEQLRFLMQDIDATCSTMINVGSDMERFVELNAQIQVEIIDTDTWVTAYIRITESVKLLNTVFGGQITLMLATSIVSYVSLLYGMIASIKEGGMQPSVYIASILTCTQLFILTTILGRCAQTARNSWWLLRRRLNKLLIFTPHGGSNYVAVRDLLRLVATRPMCVQGFGSIDLDMALLPACLALFTSYTIIALQFNNIV